MPNKKQLLPPSGASHKREVSVNLRFSVEDHARLKRIAAFSNTTVANLLFYVTMNTILPLMEQEVHQASKTDAGIVKHGTNATPSSPSGERIAVLEQDQEQP